MIGMPSREDPAKASPFCVDTALDILVGGAAGESSSRHARGWLCHGNSLPLTAGSAVLSIFLAGVVSPDLAGFCLLTQSAIFLLDVPAIMSISLWVL